jgi:hypothetical protein
MQGGSAYEPKWDGYRGLVYRTDDGCQVISRNGNGNDLTECFPDIAAAICAQLPADTLIDGELVVCRGDRIDFTALGERLTARRRCSDRAREFPATFMAFDVLRLEGVDLTRQPPSAADRTGEAGRGLVPAAAADPADHRSRGRAAVARRVRRRRPGGARRQGLGQTDRPGGRGWRKFRIRHTRDALVGAVTGTFPDPRCLVLALPAGIGPSMRIAGVTFATRGRTRRT